MNSKYTYIDLFSGAGGFSLGFENKKFKNIFSLDNNHSFCKTYRHNFPHHLLLEKDISKISNGEIKNYTKNKIVDVIIGGPPCQGFSMAGNIGRKFLDDERNYLFNEFARFVKVIKPKYFVMENVARLYTHKKGITRNEIIETFSSLGYRVECKVLNSADFGVPQIRNRVIFIGSTKKEKILFPVSKNKKHLSIKEAIERYPKLKSGEGSNVPNHISMDHTEQMLKKMEFIKDGGDRYDIPEEFRPKSGDVRKYVRYNSKKPAFCITGDMRKIFHYDQNRALTVRELANIQSFPDSFVFKGTKISQQQQLGNAVPPLLAEEIANIIIQMLRNE